MSFDKYSHGDSRMGRKVMLDTTCLITSCIPLCICFRSPGFVKLKTVSTKLMLCFVN